MATEEVPETLELSRQVLRRYIAFRPEATEDYIDFLLNNNCIDEAYALLVNIIDDDGFVSRQGKTKFELRMELCKGLAKNPSCVASLSVYLGREIEVEGVIRHCIRLYTDEVGKLWVLLSEYFTRQGLLS